MASKYHLKISRELKKIFEVYTLIDPLKRFSTISQYLHTVVNDKANEILDFLNSELKKSNTDLIEILEKKEYEEVKKALELDLRF